MSNVVTLFTPEQQLDQHLEPKCSFCGVSASRAAKLVSNPDATKHICGDCIATAKQRVQESSTQAA